MWIWHYADKDWTSELHIWKPDAVVHTCHLSPHEDEAGELPWVWGQFRLHSKYQTNQGYRVKLLSQNNEKSPQCLGNF